MKERFFLRPNVFFASSTWSWHKLYQCDFKSQKLTLWNAKNFSKNMKQEQHTFDKLRDAAKVHRVDFHFWDLPIFKELNGCNNLIFHPIKTILLFSKSYLIQGRTLQDIKNIPKFRARDFSESGQNAVNTEFTKTLSIEWKFFKDLNFLITW